MVCSTTVQDIRDAVDARADGIERWLSENRNWVVDKDRERLLISNDLGGFLKQLR